ncbi:MAG TPA: nucleoside triphosphate pyrophosphohydrolase [Myxococcota bacterium]|nr:nucleoside triphosphate pyrophosphohydrolase [Myxococcota bacterium]
MSAIDRLLEIMARLRDPRSGCPWDVEQSFATIAPYTIEEAYEVDDAIRRGDLPALRDELGDLLLQVVFHAQIAREAGHFDFTAVVDAICDKLVRRHPHVFADADVRSAAEQLDAWERHKARERAEQSERQGGAPASALDGVALGLPALLRAQKLVRRAARAGLATAPPPLEDAWGRLRAPCDDERGERVGALLLAAVAVADAAGVDAEQALREATARFEAAAREEEGAGDADPP